MEIPGGEGLQESSEWWSEMPNDLKKLALAWLPVERLCRYCLVCREWNALLSSTQFITDDWVAASPNKKPWLLFFHDWKSSNYMAYCFFTETWKRLSLAFLKKQYNIDGFSVRASAAGLFLVFPAPFHIRRSDCMYIVCNPLTEKSIELPRIDDGFNWAMTMIAEEGHGHNGDTYKVIAMVLAMDVDVAQDRVKIYDSSLKTWSTARVRLPRNFIPVRTSMIVASADFLYVKCVNANSSREGIVAFSTQNGTSVFTPLPLEDVDIWRRRDVLFTCGSRVLLGSCIPRLADIIIWELDNSHPTMVRVTEIARTPSAILDSHKRDGGVFHFGNLMPHFEGMRDLVFIRDWHCNVVLLYNLSQNTWTWLPECLRASPVNSWPYDAGRLVAFEPRPDKDVE